MIKKSIHKYRRREKGKGNITSQPGWIIETYVNREKKKKKLEEKMSRIKREGEEWKFINKIWKKNRGIGDKISLNEWQVYLEEIFQRLSEKISDSWQRSEYKGGQSKR